MGFLLVGCTHKLGFYHTTCKWPQKSTGQSGHYGYEKWFPGMLKWEGMWLTWVCRTALANSTFLLSKYNLSLWEKNVNLFFCNSLNFFLLVVVLEHYRVCSAFVSSHLDIAEDKHKSKKCTGTNYSSFLLGAPLPPILCMRTGPH